MIINKKTISTPLQVMGGILKSNSLIPILSNIFIDCKDGSMKLRVSDAETQIEFKFKYDGDDEFSFCVPGHLFIQTIIKTNTEDIELKYKERENGSKYISIKSGKGLFKIEVVSPDGFMFQDVSSDGGITISGEKFITGFKRSLLSCDKGDMRPTMNGIGIVMGKGCIEVTGSSPHIITKQILDTEFTIKPTMLSGKSSAFISNLGFKGMVTIFNNGTFFGLSSEGYHITTKLVDCDPIDLNRFWNVIPDRDITINNLDFQGAIKRASSFSSDEASTIKIEIKDSVANIIGSNNEIGHYANEEIDITNNNVEDMTIGINFNYILSAISSIPSDYITLSISESNQPIYVHGLGAEKENQSWLVMPVSII